MKKLIITTLMLISLINPSFAQTPSTQATGDETANNRPPESHSKKKTHFSLLGGPVFVVTDPSGTYFNWGASISFDLSQNETEHFNLGVFYMTTTKSDRVSSVDVDQSFSLIGIEAIGRKLFGSNVYAGGRFAYTAVTVTATSSTTSLSSSGGSFGVGPVIGVEIPAAENISLNLDLSYISVSEGDVSGDLGSISYDNLGALATRLGVQLHF